MANEVVKRDWETRVMNGVRRVSGTELGRRLEYDMANPAAFNRRVIKKHLKSGKINNLDIEAEPLSSKKGIGGSTITEYWLTIGAAYSVTMHVQTPAADVIKERVVDSLLDMAQQSQTALTVSTNPTDTVMVRVLEVLERVVDRLDGTSVASEPSLCLDKEQVRHLQGQASALAKVTGKSMTQVWYAMSEHEGARPYAKAFSTVLRSRFLAVSDILRQLTMEARAARASNRAQILTIQNPPTVDASRPANETDMGVQRVAERLTVDLEYSVSCASLSRRDGIYDVSGVDVLYLPAKGKVTSTKERPAPYLNESRYTYLLHWMKTNPELARYAIRVVPKLPLTV